MSWLSKFLSNYRIPLIIGVLLSIILTTIILNYDICYESETLSNCHNPIYTNLDPLIVVIIGLFLILFLPLFLIGIIIKIIYKKIKNRIKF